MNAPQLQGNTLIQQWIANGKNISELETDLAAEGYDNKTIAELIAAYKKQRTEKRQFNGFICLGLGAFLGFVSCLLSIFNPFPDLYYGILFGFTAFAIIVIVSGMYLVFEGWTVL